MPSRKRCRRGSLRAPQYRSQIPLLLLLLLLSTLVRSATSFATARSSEHAGAVDRSPVFNGRTTVALLAASKETAPSLHAAAVEATKGGGFMSVKKRWWDRFDELQMYEAEHGDYNVPRNKPPHAQLEAWIRTQRYQYRLYQQGKASLITNERISALEGIGFSWDRLADIWEMRFNELVQYKSEHGSCNVPFDWSNNPQLGAWVVKQRKQYRLSLAGEKSSLTPDRISKLEGIGLGQSSTFFKDRWDERLNELLEYKKRHGNCDVPQKSKEYRDLGTWVMYQRSHYRLYQDGKKSSMTSERIKKLEDAGFSWVLLLRTDWETRFEELKEYKLKHGDCNIPQGYVDNPQLAIWVQTQRQNYQLRRKGKSMRMTDGRISALESIGFEWAISAARNQGVWEKRLEELKKYKLKHGDCNVPYGYIDNPPLARWVKNQRRSYKFRQEGKSARMTDERISELESVGFEWSRCKKRAEKTK